MNTNPTTPTDPREPVDHPWLTLALFSLIFLALFLV
jgi:hypothetical protein